EDAEQAEAERGAAGAAGQSQRNPPRNWAAPPPWLSRGRGRDTGDEAAPRSLWAGADDAGDRDEDAEPPVPRRGRGLSGSYADRVASDPSEAIPGGMADDDFDDQDDARDAAAAFVAAPIAAPINPPVARSAPAPVYHAPETWEGELGTVDQSVPVRRRRERDLARPEPARADRPDAKRPGPAPEWERAKPLEAYPTIRSRRLSELSIPPILVAVVALALAAAVLFALPGLLGFGNPSAGGSPTPSTPIRTAIPSVNPTPVPQPTPHIYIVQANDTLSRIAGRFGIPLQTLIDANKENLPDPNKLQIGDQLIIPAKSPTTVPGASEIPAAT